MEELLLTIAGKVDRVEDLGEAEFDAAVHAVYKGSDVIRVLESDRIRVKRLLVLVYKAGFEVGRYFESGGETWQKS